MAAPTFIQEAETTWVADTTGNTKTTASFSVLAGDVLVAFGMHEDFGGAAASSGHLTISGGSLTWTGQQQVNVSGFCVAAAWTATVDTNKSMTVTVTYDQTNEIGFASEFGVNVLTFRGSDGVGASNQAHISLAAPTLTITTTQLNSAVVVVNADWNGVDGASRSWNTGAGAFTEETYFRDATRYTVYGGFHPNVGAAGAKTVGLNSPGGQKYSIVAVEIKGSAATGTAWALAGSTAGSSTAGATLRVAWAPVGSTAATSTVSAVLSVPAAWALAGVIAGVSTVSATLNANIKLLVGASNAAAGAGATTLITIVVPPVSFRPPTVNEVPAVLLLTHGVQRRLFRYYGPNPRGQAVVLVAGHYTTINNPSTDQLEAAGNVEGVGFFLGGHVYPRLGATVTAALIADGYGSYIQ